MNEQLSTVSYLSLPFFSPSQFFMLTVFSWFSPWYEYCTKVMEPAVFEEIPLRCVRKIIRYLEPDH